MGNFAQWHRKQIDLPVVQQSHNYDCGAACLRAVCEFFGVGPESEEEFIRACDTNPQEGTHPEGIMAAAKRFGLKAERYEDMPLRQLLHFLDQKMPVICAIQAWDEDGRSYQDNDSGHYVVAIGYDDNHIYFQDPSIHDSSRGHLTHEEFEKRWHDIDKNHRVLRNFGMVFSHGRPKETRHLKRSKRIE